MLCMMCAGHDPCSAGDSARRCAASFPTPSSTQPPVAEHLPVGWPHGSHRGYSCGDHNKSLCSCRPALPRPSAEAELRCHAQPLLYRPLLVVPRRLVLAPAPGAEAACGAGCAGYRWHAEHFRGLACKFACPPSRPICTALSSARAAAGAGQAQHVGSPAAPGGEDAVHPAVECHRRCRLRKAPKGAGGGAQPLQAQPPHPEALVGRQQGQQLRVLQRGRHQQHLQAGAEGAVDVKGTRQAAPSALVG